jgi:hypothetical protein
VVFGGHLADVPTTSVNWPAALDDSQKYVDAINAAGGDATILYLPDAGVFGNSHMLFQDKNNIVRRGLEFGGPSRSLAPVLPLH